MLIRSIGPSVEQKGNKLLQRTLNFGRYKNWSIAIDEYRDSSNKIVQKRFVFWDDFVQHIVNKKRNENGKGFSRYW